MTVFDVYVNDRKACRAGVGRDGVLTAIVNWVRLTGAAAETAHGRRRPGEEARLHVGGLRKNTHLAWVDRQLDVGDRISIVMAKSGAADAPSRQTRRNPRHEKRLQRDYYLRLKNEFEAPGSATRFLNIDLDLWSRSPLEPLILAFGRKVVTLHTGKDGREYRAHLELASESGDPDRLLRRFVRVIERLPRSARAAWNRARIREFNVGIQAAATPHSFEWRIEAETLRAVSRIKARIGTTVYGASD